MTLQEKKEVIKNYISKQKEGAFREVHIGTKKVKAIFCGAPAWWYIDDFLIHINTK